MLFYTIARQKVALNGLYNTDNNMGEPMCPPILLSGLVMLSEGLAKNYKIIILGGISPPPFTSSSISSSRAFFFFSSFFSIIVDVFISCS